MDVPISENKCPTQKMEKSREASAGKRRESEFI